MNGLQVFNYNDHRVRAINHRGEVWWALSDVCRILGIQNSRDASKRLDEDEKGVDLIDTPGGVQEMTIINESGLYTLILRSDKPEAKPFRKWVTSEVLPAIRRTGAYSAPTPPVTPQDKVLELMEELMQARQEIADIRVAAAQKEAEDLRLELEFALGHDEASERKRAQARERVRKYRERQRQEKAAQQ